MKIITSQVGQYLLALSFLGTTATLANSNCELPADLPEAVLFSTDISTVDYLPKVARELSETQYFVAEQGGGGTELTIAVQPKNIAITREFSEPGVKPYVKTYFVQCRGDTFMMGNGFALQWIPDGLIWWEANAQTNALPNDMWYFMKSVPALP